MGLLHTLGSCVTFRLLARNTRPATRKARTGKGRRGLTRPMPRPWRKDNCRTPANPPSKVVRHSHKAHRTGRSSDFQARPRGHLLSAASQPPVKTASACLALFVPGYRCGAAPDSHRIPCCHANKADRYRGKYSGAGSRVQEGDPGADSPASGGTPATVVNHSDSTLRLLVLRAKARVGDAVFTAQLGGRLSIGANLSLAF